MRLGRTRSAATAVSAGTSAQQNDNIPGNRALTPNIFCRRCGNHSTDLHTLRHIPRVITFVYLSGSKTDLVAVRRITGCSRGNNFTLRKFALKRLGNRYRGICCSRHTHGGIHICTSRQRISDRAANTSRRTAKRLNFRGVIVRLIFEQQQPRLFVTVRIYRNLDRAGIDLL